MAEYPAKITGADITAALDGEHYNITSPFSAKSLVSGLPGQYNAGYNTRAVRIPADPALIEASDAVDAIRLSHGALDRRPELVVPASTYPQGADLMYHVFAVHVHDDTPTGYPQPGQRPRYPTHRAEAFELFDTAMAWDFLRSIGRIGR